MRILMLAHRIPYPPYTGDKVRAYHVARHLARRHDVTLGFLVDEGADLAGVATLREMVADVAWGRLWKPWSVGRGSRAWPLAGRSGVVLRLARAAAGASRRGAAAFDVIIVLDAMARYAPPGSAGRHGFVDVDRTSGGRMDRRAGAHEGL